MKRITKLSSLLGIAFLSLNFASCSTAIEQETSENHDSQVSTLIVSSEIVSQWTQSRAESLPVPIRYYLFESGNENCKEMQTIETASTPAKFEVGNGTYTVIALCGDESDAPTKDNAKRTALRNLDSSNDLYLGMQDVEISKYGITQPLVIKVNHIFSSIVLTITNVPVEVTAIKAEFGKLYDSISLSGEYGGNESKSVSLRQSSSNENEWVSDENFFYPCNSSSMPITLEVASSSKTQTITTETTYIAQKGVRLSLSAQFHSESFIQSGAEIENEWTDLSGDVNFWDEEGNENEEGGNEGNEENGSEENGSEEGEGEGNGENNTTSEPNDNETTTNPQYVEGSALEGTNALIVKVNKDDNGNPTSLLLMGTVVAKDGTIASTFESDITPKITSYNNTIGNSTLSIDWRIPKIEDFQVIFDKYSNPEDLSADIKKVNETGVQINSYTYLFAMQGAGTLVALKYGTENTVTTSSEKAFCIPVATYNIP